MGITDLIAGFIRELLDDEEGSLEVQRSELAQRFNCVPSQINYVISTRFSPEHGYIVESRRGGGGYIRIQKVPDRNKLLIMHTVNAVGQQIDQMSAHTFLKNLVYADALDEKTARVMASAIGDGALRCLPLESRDCVRANILKQMLIAAR